MSVQKSLQCHGHSVFHSIYVGIGTKRRRASLITCSSCITKNTRQKLLLRTRQKHLFVFTHTSLSSFSPSRSPLVAKRAAGTSAAATGPKTKYRDLDFKVWTSDAGAYPVMGVLAFACLVSASYGTYNLLNSPDIRIQPSKRESVVRTWG